jgi:hypothetical protein
VSPGVYYSETDPDPGNMFTFTSAGVYVILIGSGPTGGFIPNINLTMTETTFSVPPGAIIYWVVSGTVTLANNVPGNFISGSSLQLNNSVTANGFFFFYNNITPANASILNLAISPQNSDIPQCLDGSTLILLGDGSTKPIREIQRGDLVSANLDCSIVHRVSRLVKQYQHPLAYIDVIVFEPNSISPGQPQNRLIISQGHPIFYRGCRYIASCFEGLHGVKRYNVGYDVHDVLNVDSNGNYYYYDLQFDDDGTFVAEGIIVQSRSPWSHLTPLPKELYFDESLYREERTEDSIHHEGKVICMRIC